MRLIPTVVVNTALLSAALAFASACPPAPAADALPPPGLAGAPGAQPAPATTLPGAGLPVPAPTGGTPSTSLPPGHPPIDGAAGAPEMNGGGAGGGGGGGTQDVTITGVVLETMDVPEYTYMRLKSASEASGDVWVAVNKTPIAVGDTVTVSSQLVMENFNSKGLNRTFPKLVMGMLVGAPTKQ